MLYITEHTLSLIILYNYFCSLYKIYYYMTYNSIYDQINKYVLKISFCYYAAEGYKGIYF